MFCIAHAVPSQAPEIAAVYVRTRQRAYASFFPAEVLAAMSATEETAKWQKRIGAAQSRTIVALDTSKAVAGFTHVTWQQGATLETGEVEFMYVATEHQGNGLGATLMAEAETTLAAVPVRDAILWVYEGNTAARAFYERCGWYPDGARRASDSAPGLYLARYRKHLS